jgi:hypothetical protein
MPNNRQLAVLILLAVAALPILMNRDLRRSSGSVVRSLLASNIAIVLTLMVLWVGGEILVAQRLSVWDKGMTTSTVFWFVGTGFVLFLNTPKATEDKHFFRRNLFTMIKLSFFLGFFMNLFVLNLPAELVLQVMLSFLVAISVVASHKDEFKLVKKLVDALLGLTFIGLIIYELAMIASNWISLGRSGVARQFFLPIWLTVGLLPFIYLAGVYSEYELAFLRTEWGTGRIWSRRMALLVCFGLQSHKLHIFIKDSAYHVAQSSSFADARRIIRQVPDHGDFGDVDEDVSE